jgi:hypothetical protein
MVMISGMDVGGMYACMGGGMIRGGHVLALSSEKISMRLVLGFRQITLLYVLLSWALRAVVDK